MRATTFKIEDPLIGELSACKPEDKSLSAFIREILEREVTKKKLIEASQKYSDFLKSHSQEREWLEDWESADLVRPPKRPSERPGRKSR
jgi:predicted CopG family antitoxin